MTSGSDGILQLLCTFQSFLSNVVDKWVALLLIREVLGSNLGQGTGYPD
jgi:hypothetical protein